MSPCLLTLSQGAQDTLSVNVALASPALASANTMDNTPPSVFAPTGRVPVTAGKHLVEDVELPPTKKAKTAVSVSGAKKTEQTVNESSLDEF